MASRAGGPVRIDLPEAGKERSDLGRVGVIAAVGFAVGVLWPRLAGVKLVPDAPYEAPPPASAAPSLAAEARPGPADAPPTAALEPAPAAPPRAPAPSRVKLGRMQITSCRDASGRKFTHCGELALDDVAPRLEALGACEGTEKTVGTLSLGFDLDFAAGRVTEVHAGRSTTVAEGPRRLLVACATRALEGLALGKVARQHARYTVYFPVDLVEVPAGAPEVPPTEAKGAADDATPASGVATVAWEAALIRKAPRDGDVVARILSGTRVTVTGRKGDWYRIKYDAKGSEGWVYRGAIGL